jgi:hypothetical protein
MIMIFILPIDVSVVPAILLGGQVQTTVRGVDMLRNLMSVPILLVIDVN